MLLTDASQNTWEKRWFVLRRSVYIHPCCGMTLTDIRPYLHIYSSSNELEEVGIASLTGVNVESNPEMETILGVRSRHMVPISTLLMNLQKRFCFTLFTSTNSYALSAPSQKELQAWTVKLDPTRTLS